MSLLKRRLSIDDFILEMMRVPASELQLPQLQYWVARLDLKDDLFRQHISFCCQDYQRKLLCRTSRFDMLILCWQPNQFSSIHHHSDSLCVTRVYQGILTSRTFDTKVSPTETASLVKLKEEYLQKNELAAVNRYEIHQLANTSTENLVTLHVYARPLKNLEVYSPNTGKAELVPVQYALEEELV